MSTTVTLINPDIEKDFYALAAEYLPGSEQSKMRLRAMEYPKAFLALVRDSEVIGAAFGWPRSLDAPQDITFTLDGITIKEHLHRNGYGTELLRAFEKAAREYGYTTISVGSAGGYVESFYINNGFQPVMYKVWGENGPEIDAEFHNIEEYYAYQRPQQEGFLVLEKCI